MIKIVLTVTQSLSLLELLARIPKSKVVSVEKKRVAWLSYMFKKPLIISIKLAGKQTFEKISFSLYLGLVLDIAVVVEGFKIVECSRIVIQEISKEG